MFQPYRIALAMRTPIVPGKFPLHLDSLFYWFLSEFMDNDEEILDIMDTVLEKQDDTYLCSAMYFQDKPKYISCGVMSKSDTMIDNLIDMQAWTDDKVIGETKMASVHAIAAKTAFFNATCDKEKAEALLKKIHGVGRLTNTGFGEIASISFVQLNRDLSVISDGRLMRVVKDIGLTPEQLKQLGGVKDYGRYSPPYHTHSKSAVIIPKRLIYTLPLNNAKNKGKK